MRLAEAKQRYRNVNTDHGPDLPSPRPAGRRPQDRLPGHLLADPDLVLRAHRGAPDVQGASSSSTSSSGSATTASGPRWTGRPRSSSGTSRAGWAGPQARRVDVTRCPEYRDVIAAVNAVAANFGAIGGMKMAEDLKTAAKPDVEGADRILQMTTDLQRRRAAADPARLPLSRARREPDADGARRPPRARSRSRRSRSATRASSTSTSSARSSGRAARRQLPVPLRLPDLQRERAVRPAHDRARAVPGRVPAPREGPGREPQRGRPHQGEAEGPGHARGRDDGRGEGGARGREKAVTRLVENAGAPKGALSLLPIAREIATGLIRFETRTSSNDVAFTEFYLNNTRVVTKRRPPFEADLDLGELPRKHVVKVIGYSKDGQAIAAGRDDPERGARGVPRPDHEPEQGGAARGRGPRRRGPRRARDEAAQEGRVLRERPPRRDALPGAVPAGRRRPEEQGPRVPPRRRDARRRPVDGGRPVLQRAEVPLRGERQGRRALHVGLREGPAGDRPQEGELPGPRGRRSPGRSTASRS